MNYRIVPVTAFVQNYSLIWCEQTHLVALVDPDGDAEHTKAVMAETDVTLIQTLLAYGHLNHVDVVTELVQHYGVPVIGPEKEDEFWLEGSPAQGRMFSLEDCQPLRPNRWLNEGDVVNVGDVALQVLRRPDHTSGHMAFFDDASRSPISGDVIFKGGMKHSDFPCSDHGQLIAATKNKLLPLGDDMTLIPGHSPLSALDEERRNSPFLQDEMPI